MLSNEDAFAQTGSGQDALFDEVVPVDESMRVRSDDDLFSDDFTPVAPPKVEQAAPPSRGRGDRSRGQARSRGRGSTGQSGGLERSIHAPQNRPDDTILQQKGHDHPESAPAGPRKETVAAVRGDRHATGGLKKPKLTETELAEKMAQITIKNASLTAAHARAEADAASFAERESQAKVVTAQKQREERRDRQQMMGEREKNRMRKLKAMGGREWDAEKDENARDKAGNFAGDKADYEYNDGRDYLYKEPRTNGRNGGSGAGAKHAQQQTLPKQEEDFPALPKAEAPAIMTKADATASWADQVESAT